MLTQSEVNRIAEAIVKKQTEQKARRLLDIAEAAQYTHMSESFLRKKVYSGELRSVRIGKRRFYRPVDLDELMSFN